MNINEFAERLIVTADAMEAFPRLPSREIFDRIVHVEIERSNGRMFRTRGKSIQGSWGTYAAKHHHPLPKDPGETYWLIDKDYYSRGHLRTSLIDLRSKVALVKYQGGRNYRRIIWSSKVPYADNVNRRYGHIYGLDKEARKRIQMIIMAKLYARISRAFNGE